MKYYWQDFGSGLCLVSDETHHRPIILAASGRNKRSGSPPPPADIVVRDERGILVPITPEHPVAKKLEAMPDLIEAAKQVIIERGMKGDSYKEPDSVVMARAALRKAGLL